MIKLLVLVPRQHQIIKHYAVSSVAKDIYKKKRYQVAVGGEPTVTCSVFGFSCYGGI